MSKANGVSRLPTANLRLTATQREAMRALLAAKAQLDKAQADIATRIAAVLAEATDVDPKRIVGVQGQPGEETWALAP